MKRTSYLTFAIVLLSVSGVIRAQLQSMPSDGGGRMLCGGCTAPQDIPSSVTIAAQSEPGERLIISGRLFKAGGTSPASGITLFLYHTDAKGHYNPQDDPFHPRLYGWVRTDSDGRYEIRSIKPAAYPDRKIPIHIHVHIFGPGIPERSIPEFNFQDDPLLSADQRAQPSRLGSFSPVVALQRSPDGTWRGTRDITLGAPPIH